MEKNCFSVWQLNNINWIKYKFTFSADAWCLFSVNAPYLLNNATFYYNTWQFRIRCRKWLFSLVQSWSANNRNKYILVQTNYIMGYNTWTFFQPSVYIVVRATMHTDFFWLTRPSIVRNYIFRPRLGDAKRLTAVKYWGLGTRQLTTSIHSGLV